VGSDYDRQRCRYGRDEMSETVNAEETPEKHIGWVTKLAAHWATKFNEPVQDSEYYGDAWIGFLRARERFDPSRGFAFLTYATPVIISSIIHGIKKRKKKRLNIDGTQHIVRQFGALEQEDIRDTRRSALEEAIDSIHSHDMVKKLQLAIDQLPEMNARVIRMRLDGMMLREIADEIGVSKQRIAQIEKRGHKMLRMLLQEKCDVVMK
jgi:RNA polymerase sigma factor (sigma-70 family)